jgi:hypothetical protein
MKRLLLWTSIACLGCGACQSSSPRLNSPPHGQADDVSDLQGTYVQMTDNALLADMTVADIHFVPNRAMLNALGEERLCRLAALMEIYGGTVRLNTNLADEALVKERLDQVTKYLAEAGVDTSGHVVVLGMPDGRGMSADEAILIKQNEGTYKPKKSAGGSGALPTGGGSGSSPTGGASGGSQSY